TRNQGADHADDESATAGARHSGTASLPGENGARARLDPHSRRAADRFLDRLAAAAAGLARTLCRAYPAQVNEARRYSLLPNLRPTTPWSRHGAHTSQHLAGYRSL